MKEIVVVGDLNLDIILSRLENNPSPGKETIAQDHAIKAGGSAANVAMMLAVNECPVKLFAQVGKDFAGDWIIKYLQSCGLNTGTLSISETVSTGVTVSLDSPEDRMYVTSPGTISSTRLQNLQKGYLVKGAHMHLSSYFLQAMFKPDVGRLLFDAKGAGMTTSLDPGGDTSGRWNTEELNRYLGCIDYFLPNIDEIRGITRKEDVEQALQSFPKELKCVIVKAGKEGVFSWQNDKIEHHPALPAQVVDKTCAGDCFDAGFLIGISKGLPLHDAIELGIRFGAEAVSVMGLPMYRIVADQHQS
jgi:sugar/nucleoside kinase (ribokinase family)